MSAYFAHESAYIDEGAQIGEGTKVWHFSHVLPKAIIGKNCVIGQNCVVMNNVLVGDFCKIQNNVSLYEGVVLEDYVFCGPSMVFTNVLIPRCEFPRATSEHYLPTLVKRGASIGANATIVCGVTLGERCLIGAGAVVTKDVPPNALMVGVPAKQIGWACRDGQPVFFHELDTPEKVAAMLERTGDLGRELLDWIEGQRRA
ncbi:MAG: N-acetyltransferase [Fimbriimonadaceae bacterium]|nr:N-acetyltransferase [Fimbriimonadaceae bacterium]QYK57784.1 MAG: N-acetyltransferase [Fimbriimonadaceae bacterium]